MDSYAFSLNFMHIYPNVIHFLLLLFDCIFYCISDQRNPASQALPLLHF